MAVPQRFVLLITSLLLLSITNAQSAEKATLKVNGSAATSIRFPLRLLPGFTTAVVDGVLQSQGFRQDGSAESKKYSDITEAISHKHYKPTGLNLEYWQDKLFNLRVTHGGIDGCENMIQIYSDAISFIKSNYDLSKATVSSGHKFGSKQCKDYMEEGNVIWGVITKDYQLSVDSFWLDDSYYVYVAYMYLPIKKQSDAKESGEMKKSDERSRSNL